MARFFIRRLDGVGSTDGIVIESEGITIGRAPSSDILLNNRSVSRTHAGIKEIEGEYWLFNLSGSNGTFLNGTPADKIPLADGDVIQVGPYYLQIQYPQGVLSITVKMELEVQSVAAKSVQSGTMMGNLPMPPQKKGQTIGGSLRQIGGTGFMTSMIPPPDEEALRIFWEKRKREAGKIGIKTPLRPTKARGVGKTQFNWRPTLDLKKLWRKSAFIWGALVVGLSSLVFLIIFMDAFSPQSLSGAHQNKKPPGRPIAKQANAGSCTTCHGVFHGIQANCTSCHHQELGSHLLPSSLLPL